MTFYHQSDLDLMPDFTDYSMKGRTYRYFTHKPLYPFGYGLTYSRVEVNSAECRSIDGGFVVKVSAKNTGRVDTDDVIQVYAHNRGSRNAPENPRLVGFKRISVGSSKKVDAEILISDEDLLVVDQNGDKVKEGAVVLYVGTCQPDDYSCKLSGTEIIQIEVG